MDKMTSHYLHLANERKTLAFDGQKPFEPQRQAVKEKYLEMLKMPKERGEDSRYSHSCGEFGTV